MPPHLERKERLLNIPPPRVRALPPGTPRGEGRIIDVPSAGCPYGIISLDGSPISVKVPKEVIDAAHHRNVFARDAIADVSYTRDGATFVALRINTVRKKRATA